MSRNWDNFRRCIILYSCHDTSFYYLIAYRYLWGGQPKHGYALEKNSQDNRVPWSVHWNRVISNFAEILLLAFISRPTFTPHVVHRESAWVVIVSFFVSILLMFWWHTGNIDIITFNVLSTASKGSHVQQNGVPLKENEVFIQEDNWKKKKALIVTTMQRPVFHIRYTKLRTRVAFFQKKLKISMFVFTTPNVSTKHRKTDNANGWPWMNKTRL